MPFAAALMAGGLASADADSAFAQPAPSAAPPAEAAPAEAGESAPAAPVEPVEVTAATAPAEAEAPPPALEVTIEGEKAPPGSTSFRRRDIREMPGVFGDPYRAIEVQPGVTPAASGIPYYFIRGAPPGNIGYFFDGIQVPLLFHVGGGPSVIPAAIVQRVELHPGTAPVDTGRFAGAVVEAESAPLPYQWRGEAAIRAGDIGGVIEGPLTENVTVLAGGHYSAATTGLLTLLVPSLSISYADYQARVSWKLGTEARLTLFAFGAFDYLATHAEEGGLRTTDVLLDSDFHRLDLRYDRETAAGGKLRAAVTLGLDQSRSVGVKSARDWKVSARLSAAQPVAEGRVVVRGGADVAVDGYEIQPKAPRCAGVCPESPDDSGTEQIEDSFPELFPSRVDLAVGAWADALIALGESSTITPGVRVDHYRSLGETALAVDPRVVGRFGLNEHLKLVSAVGMASQLPGFAPLPALQIGGIKGGLQRSLQSSFGAEVKAGPVEMVTSVFRNATFNLSDPVGTDRGTRLGADRFLTRSLGDAYGLEVGARGALRRDMFFMMSYTLARATRTREGLVLPSAYDRTHVGQVALLYDLGSGWRAGVRHVFYSGFPADEVVAGRAPSEHPDRVRPFYRFDVRASKRWKIGKGGYLGLILDLQNATLSREVFDVACDDKGCTPRMLGPITIPGLALEAGF